MQMFKIIIAGGRHFLDYKLLSGEVEKFITEQAHGRVTQTQKHGLSCRMGQIRQKCWSAAQQTDGQVRQRARRLLTSTAFQLCFYIYLICNHI